ncbi:C40 family peptidase [Citreicella sp. C3M06]|uniref:C40 family peptidase n=1 Tax=Citreicella sp. C3M06 TaxID=2841564 RepID=UPI001C083ED2|nr:NlpC/P60 family protein [Citreicella sp. C3M06]MBU2960485.1 C40 family peptidase [Citreicella sp. C3M06]
MTFSSFVGIPHLDLGLTRAGADCYGLVWLVYAEALGVELPRHDCIVAAETPPAERAAHIAGGLASGPWRRVEQIRPFDLLLFNVRAQGDHVAVAVTPRLMLHNHARSQSAIVDFNVTPWPRRFAGAYRHESQ